MQMKDGWRKYRPLLFRSLCQRAQNSASPRRAGGENDVPRNIIMTWHAISNAIAIGKLVQEILPFYRNSMCEFSYETNVVVVVVLARSDK